MKAKDPLDEVNRRFGRISGTLAVDYIAVFAKFGLWQALTERCCGTVETAGVGTAVALIVAGTALVQVIGNGFVYVYCHFRTSDSSRAQDVLRQVLQVCAAAILTVAVCLWFAREPILGLAELTAAERMHADSFWRWGCCAFPLLSAVSVQRWIVLMDGGLRRCVVSALVELAVLGAAGVVLTGAFGTAGGVMLAEAVADATGVAILVGYFKGRLKGFRIRWKVSLRDVRSALAYSVGDVLQCLSWMISLAVICLFSLHRFGESSFQVMSVLFQCVALSLVFMGVSEGFFPLAQEFRQKGDAASYGRLVRVARRSAVKAGLGTSVLLAVCSPWAPGWVGVDGPEAVQSTRMLVILVPFLPISALLMVRVAELFEGCQVLRGTILILFKDLFGLSGLTVLGGVFWGMDGMWCGMLVASALALPLAFLPNRKIAVKKHPDGLSTPSGGDFCYTVSTGKESLKP